MSLTLHITAKTDKKQRRSEGLVMRLIADRLTCLRGGRTVFEGLGFALAAGQALAVTGPNGAGKSSLLRLIAGLITKEAGTMTLEAGHPELTIAEQAHLLGHRDAIKPSLTVWENLAFWQGFLGGAPGISLGNSLDQVGLAHLADIPAAYLSAGQKRRLAFARLLVTSRPVWLLDEPTSALDAAAKSMIARLMTGHLQSGGLIVAATHDPLNIPASELRIGAAA